MTAQRWERLTSWPLTGLALAFLLAYAWPILDPSLPGGARTVTSTFTTVAWLAFAVDYAVRIALADRRWHYVLHHPLDLAVVALPMLRPLRLLRLVTLLSVLNRHAGSALRGRVVSYTIGSAVMLSGIAALAVLDAERRAPQANITGIGDALWWSLTTMTTVGYGDLFPVTTTGRLVGAGLMLGGIALLGVVTATIASWLVDRVAQEDQREHAATREQVAELLEEVRALRDDLVVPTQREATDEGLKATAATRARL
jgi:voltage-gated potassium channel